jgi:hypothetical protein
LQAFSKTLWMAPSKRQRGACSPIEIACTRSIQAAGVALAPAGERIWPNTPHRLFGIGNPAEDPALRLDHLERHALELRKVRADAVGQH